MNEKEQNIKIYTQNASAMAKKFSNIGTRVKDVKKAFSYIKKENPKVMELGCAYGKEAREISKYTNNYLGLDYSEKFIKMAQKNVPDVKFRVVDFENYNFPGNLDIIFAFASLLHSDKGTVKVILNKAYEALNKNGIFYILLKYDKYHKETKTDKFGKRTTYFYTPEDIKKLAGRKYKILEKDKQFLRGQEWFTIILQKT